MNSKIDITRMFSPSNVLILLVSLLPIAFSLRFKLSMVKNPTALDVINKYGQGKYLKGKLAIVTGIYNHITITIANTQTQLYITYNQQLQSQHSQHSQ